jgi:hypothetical protein
VRCAGMQRRSRGVLSWRGLRHRAALPPQLYVHTPSQSSVSSRNSWKSGLRTIPFPFRVG